MEKRQWPIKYEQSAGPRTTTTTAATTTAAAGGGLLEGPAADSGLNNGDNAVTITAVPAAAAICDNEELAHIIEGGAANKSAVNYQVRLGQIIIIYYCY